ncbi:MAG: hypothetical protein AUH89_00155 [Ktedonobacter sp. 13_1_40CM_4_52_4]|nr:MAG: hypothetical protein AUH89_00155 [Ktedonobacter sp. 13_1_40CM_4_52_4]
MKALQPNAHLVAHLVGRTKFTGKGHTATNGLSHIIEEFLPKCEDERVFERFFIFGGAPAAHEDCCVMVHIKVLNAGIDTLKVNLKSVGDNGKLFAAK